MRSVLVWSMCSALVGGLPVVARSGVLRAICRCVVLLACVGGLRWWADVSRLSVCLDGFLL